MSNISQTPRDDSHLATVPATAVPLIQIDPAKTYTVNECFMSLQGEGIRAGTLNIFLRFSGCNQKCLVETHGFDCDTEFVSGRKLTAAQIVELLQETGPQCRWVILTGGEPGLQVDASLIATLKDAGYFLAIESNGSIELPKGLDWITISPKVAEHAIRQKLASEVKYVRGYGQGIPRPVCKAANLLISPAFNGQELDRKSLAWCIKLIEENPTWRLSVQLHKDWVVR